VGHVVWRSHMASWGVFRVLMYARIDQLRSQAASSANGPKTSIDSCLGRSACQARAPAGSPRRRARCRAIERRHEGRRRADVHRHRLAHSEQEDLQPRVLPQHIPPGHPPELWRVQLPLSGRVRAA
jgi:hypothetical protein